MSDFIAAFDRLKAILSAYEAQMKLDHDTSVLGPNKKPLLLDEVPEPLKKRMQGKACFNFKTVDEALLGDLAAPTRRGFDRMKQDWLDLG